MNVSQPRLTIATACSTLDTSPNSVTSAPAMKPLALPDRMISAFGGSRSNVSSASFNSASACCDSVFVVAPARSNVSVATPSSARVICQFCMATLDALDEHCAALSAADADRGDASLAAGALEHVQQMQHDSRAGRADGMADRD